MIASIETGFKSLLNLFKPKSEYKSWYEHVNRGDQQLINFQMRSAYIKIYPMVDDTSRGKKVTFRDLYHYESELKEMQQNIENALKLIKKAR